MADPKIKIPGNLANDMDAIAERNGIPLPVLAAVIQQNGWTAGVDVPFINQVAQTLKQTYSGVTKGDPMSNPNWLDVATKAFGASAAYRTRLGNLMQEDATGLSDDERWMLDTNNSTPAGNYTRATIRTPDGTAIGGQKIVQGGTAPLTGDNSTADISDIYGLFNQYLGRPPKNDEEAKGWGRVGQTVGSLRTELMNSAEGTTYRQNAGTIKDASGWVNGQYQKLLGRPATNDEIVKIAQNGWNAQTLESYLRSQPYGNTTKTIGQASDLRTEMQRQAQTVLGRDATPEEINFAVVNGIPSKDASAFYEQVRDKTVWAGDPDKYRSYRTQLAAEMRKNGINVQDKDVDPSLVNSAVKGGWNADQVTQAIGSGQMPGTPTGTTVARYGTTKQMADKIWGTYFPTTPMPQPYINQMLLMTPDQMTTFVGSMPSLDAAQAGIIIPVKTYTDAKAAATASLQRFGQVGRQPSPQEIAAFAQSGADTEAIAKHYSQDPAILAQNPGAQYGNAEQGGMSRDSYYKERKGLEQAYGQRFGDPDTLKAVEEKVNNPTTGVAPKEADWEKTVFRENINPVEAQQAFDTYFKNVGAAPTAEDLSRYTTRSKEVFNDDSEIRKSNSASFGVGQNGKPSTLTPQRTGISG